jgi:hypothetical protein
MTVLVKILKETKSGTYDVLFSSGVIKQVTMKPGISAGAYLTIDMVEDPEIYFDCGLDFNKREEEKEKADRIATLAAAMAIFDSYGELENGHEKEIMDLHLRGYLKQVAGGFNVH